MAFPRGKVYLGGMTLLRPLIALFLALTITLTSGAMAVARGNARAGMGMITLCTGYGPQQVTVDKDGQPVGPAHFCPDCALAAFFLPGAPTGTPAVRLVESRLSVRPDIPSSLAIETATPQARGPPVAA